MRLKAVEVKFPPLTRRSITGLMIMAMVLSVLGTTGWRGYTMGGASNYVRGMVAALGQGGEAEQEPNETVEQANPIAVPGQRTGTVRYGDAALVEFTYNNGPRDRVEDLFSFVVSPTDSGRVDLQLSFTNPAADLDLILFRREVTGGVTPLAVSNGSTTTERITLPTALGPGQYLVGVSAFDNPGNTAETGYTLLLTGDGTVPAPVVSDLNPVSVAAGSGAISLTINGRNFYAGQSEVRWNDQPRPTTFINSQQVVAFLTPGDIAAPGTARVMVVNPSNLGGASGPVNFTILAPGVPEIEAEPNETSAQAGLLLVPGKRSGTIATGDAAGLTISLSNGLSDPVEDLFVVNLMESKRLDLSLIGTDPAADLALYLLQESETTGQVTVLGNSRLKGAAQQITTPLALPAGRYLVGVSAVKGQTGYVVQANVPGGRLLQVSSSSAAPGSTVTAPVTFMAQGDETLLAFSLGFDPARVSAPEFIPGSGLNTANVRVDKTEVAQGRLGVEIRLPSGQTFNAGLVEIGRLNLQLASGNGVVSTVIDFQDRPIVRSVIDRGNQAVIGSYAAGTVVAIPGFEADLVPRPNGGIDGAVTIADWTQTGRFVASLDAVASGSEFQRADSAPRTTQGDGRLTIADWVMAGRYASGLEVPTAAGGPSAPALPATLAGEALKIYQGQSADGVVAGLQNDRALRIRPTLFSRGRENELIVELVSQGNENALGFSLDFDLTQLGYVRAALGSDAAGAALNINTNRLAEGRLGFGLALPSNQAFPAGIRQVLKIVFAVPHGGTVNATTVSFGNLPITREVVDPLANILPADYVAGEVRLDPPVDQIPTMTGLDPATILAGRTSQTVAVAGTNFIEGAVVLVGGVERATTFVSTTRLQFELQPADLIEPGTLEVEVRNPAPGNGRSNRLVLTVINPVPVLESLTPEVAGVGGLSFTLTVNGRNFVRGSEIEFNGKRRGTTLVSQTRLTTLIPATEIATLGTVPVRVITPEPGGGASNELTFAIKPLNPLPRVTSISPNSVEKGSGDQTIVITGTSFVEGASVQIGADRLPATFVSATELRVVIEASRMVNPGSLLLSVSNPAPGGGNSNWVTLTVTPPRHPVPTLTGLSPANVLAGGPTFTVTLNGNNFIESSAVQVNGVNHPAVYVSPTVMTIQIASQMIISAENLSIRVVNPAPGGGTSAVQTLSVFNPVPVLTALTPNSVVDGNPSFTLTLVGNGFVPESKILIDGVTRNANFIAGTQLSLQISAAEVATIKTLQVKVFNPTPGGGTSNTLNLIVRQPNPLPRVAAVRPADVKVGGPGFVMTVEGVRFVSDSIIRINNQPRQTEFISETLLATRIEAEEIASATEMMISVYNPAPGGGQSSGVSLLVLNPTPRISAITPTVAQAGDPGLELIVFGEGFIRSSTVRFNGTDLVTTLVSGSQLTARIPAALLTGGGNQLISVFNPLPGGGNSNIANLAVRNPVPTINRLTPSTLTAGGSPEPLTIEGTGLVSNSVVRVNGQDRPTTWVNGGRVTVLLTAGDIATGGTLNISIFNPAPEGGVSNTLTLGVSNPVPALTALSPAVVGAGDAGFRLVLSGTGFVPSSVVRFNGVARATTFVNGTSLAVDIAAAEIEEVGTATLSVVNPTPGGGVSAPLTLAINSPIPVLTSITPAGILVGSPPPTLVLNGSGFLPGSVVQWNGTPRPTIHVSRSELRVEVRASDIATAGQVRIGVVNPAPGGGPSNTVQLEVVNPVPTITSTTPQSVIVGSPWFTLTVRGTGFVPGAVVNWNGQARTTFFVSGTELRLDVSATDVAAIAGVELTVVNPTPGGGASSPRRFEVTPLPNPVPVLESVSPASALEGDPGLTLTINGRDFVNGATLLWQGSPRATSFVSSTQLQARIGAADLVLAGNIALAVFNPAPGGGSSNQIIFYINPTATNCQTLCMQSADYYLQNISRLPRGIIWINRYLYNITSGSVVIKRALEGGATLGQQLTREFTAAQLTTAGGGNTPGVLNSELSCYRLNFSPVALSNGGAVSRQSTLIELFNLTRTAINENREADIALLLPIFQQLNGNDPLNRCR
jgi:hypothetical protein